MTDDANNTVLLKGEEKSRGKYIKIKVLALQDSDYSMEMLRDHSKRWNNGDGHNSTEDVYYPAMRGRPMSFMLSH